MTPKLKTLVVEYAPRGDESRTKKLRTYFTELIKQYTDFEFLDVSVNPPQYLTKEVVEIYYKRNYNGEQLTKAECEAIAPLDAYRDQLMRSDVLIISSPMYNFGFPAPVKGWIDAVMQRGHAYTTDDVGHIPLLKHLKVCIIYTSGIVFDQINENETWNGITAEGQKLFEYMGAQEVRMVHVQGIDMLEERFVEYRTKNIAQLKLNGLATKWYHIDIQLKTYL